MDKYIEPSYTIPEVYTIRYPGNNNPNNTGSISTYAWVKGMPYITKDVQISYQPRYDSSGLKIPRLK